MNPQGAHDVLLCHICETHVPTYQCDFCKINVCKTCAGVHLLNESKNHDVIRIQQPWSTTYPNCRIHSMKQCVLFCEQCDLNICAECISSGEHERHEKIDILKKFDKIKEALQRSFKELENIIFPEYQAAVSSITVKKEDLLKNSQIIKKSIQEQGDVWHKEIDKIVQDLQSESNKMESEQLGFLETQENKINQRISKVSRTINYLKRLMDSDDICLVLECSVSIGHLNTLPPYLNLALPQFSPQSINKKELGRQFGSLSTLSVTWEERFSPQGSTENDPSLLVRPMLDEPKITSTIDTQHSSLYNVACRNDDEIWTRGLEKNIELYNLKGDLLESIKTKSWNEPCDITVLKSGELVYTEPKTSSVNIRKNAQTETLIKPKGLIRRWKPLGVSATLSGDLLVSMVSVDHKQARVVRYSGSQAKQSIQWDEQGHPLYSTGFNTKYLSENKNLDICVADHGAKALVVVTSSGEFQFRYTGDSHRTSESFAPLGITTDSHCRIITADYVNKLIHILNQDGYFLRHIVIDDLGRPWGLCIDTNDKLIVAEWDTGKLKKIQYCK